jgi:hypothetical protein
VRFRGFVTGERLGTFVRRDRKVVARRRVRISSVIMLHTGSGVKVSCVRERRLKKGRERDGRRREGGL